MVSTSRTSTSPAKAALAKPVPIAAATLYTLTKTTKTRGLPSGNVVTGITVTLYNNPLTVLLCEIVKGTTRIKSTTEIPLLEGRRALCTN